VDVKTQKNVKSRRITVSAVTQTHIIFRRYELDTAAGLARRILFWKGVVQGRSETRQVHANVKTKKKNLFKKGETVNQL